MKLNSNHPTVKEWTRGGTVLHESEDKFQTLRVLVKHKGNYDLLRAWKGMNGETVYVSVDVRTAGTKAEHMEEIVMNLMEQIGQ